MKPRITVQPVVFGVSAIVIALFVVLGAVFDEWMGRQLDTVQRLIVHNLGWFYTAGVAVFFLFVVWMFFSPFGRVKLGKDDDEPDYSYWTWFAMLFSAGMGIGLLFFSVAEPMLHFASPPPGGEARTVEAAREAMRITFFHWGLHAWAIYIVVAMSLAYFAFRHGLPLSIRSALYPLIGRRVHGGIGHAVDIMAVFGTLFGLATSLGLGVIQINAGLEYLNVMSISATNQVILIAVITLAAAVSVFTGLDVGVRRLSELNLIMAGALLLFVLCAGPTVFLLSSFVQNIGRYASGLVQMTFKTDAFTGQRGLEWQGAWTMFYWAWWISWSPFVGMFIARVSRGRTIREFIAGVLFVPALLTFFWLTVFGNTALSLDLFGPGGMADAVLAENGIASAIFVMLQQLPLPTISAILATTVVAIFFVTSSDSGSLVIDIITSGGRTDAPVWQRLFWAFSEGAVAAVLLLTGGLAALQTAAIITALPFAIVMLLICVGLVKGLRAEVGTSDPVAELLHKMRHLPGEVRAAVTGGAPPAARNGAATGRILLEGNWRGRLGKLLDKVGHYRREEASVDHGHQTIKSFIENTVVPAFEEVRSELRQYGREATIESNEREASLSVWRGDQEEFAYAIRGHVYHKLNFAFPEQPDPEAAPALEKAEVVLRSGRQHEYELRHWTKQGIIDDFIRSYARWMGW